MGLFKNKQTKAYVQGFRLEVPINTAPGLPHAADFHPGDWLIIDRDQLAFTDDTNFRQQFEPVNKESLFLWERTDYDAVLDATKPMIPKDWMVEGREYCVHLDVSGKLYCYRGWYRGRVESGAYTLAMQDHPKSHVAMCPEHQIAFVVPMDPETEPCLLQSKEPTESAKGQHVASSRYN